MKLVCACNQFAREDKGDGDGRLCSSESATVLSNQEGKGRVIRGGPIFPASS